MKKFFTSIWVFIKTVFIDTLLSIFKIPRFLYREHPGQLTELTADDYHAFFKRPDGTCDLDKAKAAYEKAWDSKKFEIDLYWKRATYFWAFLVPVFAGYIAVLNSKDFEKETPKHPEILYYLVCIGFVLSMAWVLVNKGSKSWQRQWEKHVDMLEDYVTGPIYKTVFHNSTYSVSKINEIVSRFFVVIWLALGYGYWHDQHITLQNTGTVNWYVLIATLAALFFVFAMFFGYGRGYFGTREIVPLKRNVKPK